MARARWMAVPAALAVMAVTSPAQAQYVPPTPEYLDSLSWTQAYNALVDKMAREYAFTKWKGISWAKTAAAYRSRIEKAEAAGDLDAYYLTLREFIHQTHDGHVSIHSADEAIYNRLLNERAGGGYGLVLSRLDGGDVSATWVQKGGVAWQAGVRRGAVVTEWDGRRIAKAMKRTSTVLAPNQPTTWRVRYEQLRFLVRDAVGTKRAVTFANPGGPTRTVRLRAVDDGMRTLEMTDMSSVLAKRGLPKKMVTSRMLPGRIGYVRVKAEIDLPAEFPGDHTPTLRQFRDALRTFKDMDVKGLVVDVRANAGGVDQMVADMLASFYDKRSFYEYQNYINAATGRFEIWKADENTGEMLKRGVGIPIKPAAPRFRRPVVALVDNACISSCEGIAMGLKRLPNARVVGFEGTNGSFGMVGDGVLMPGGIQIGWPFGQSLDKDKVVQIDSRDGKGGVLPNVVVPSTQRNLSRYLAGHDVVLARGVRELQRLAGE